MSSITAKELKELIARDNNLVLIDVRTKEEIADGRIPNAEWMNVYDRDFMERVSALPKEKTYCLYCASGARTMMAVPYMKEQGFTNVFQLDGGISAWAREGGEIA